MENECRLPKCIIPLHYDLFINPDIQSLTFKGMTNIDIEIREKTKLVYIHSSELAFENIILHIDSTGQQHIKSLGCKYDEKNEIMRISFPQDIDVGKAKLEITFSGKIDRNMKGFYLSQYTDCHKTVRKCLSTQFEPTDARRAFPCFDEPCFKSTFQLTLIAPPGKTVLSNTELLSLTPHDDQHMAYKFEVTPKMSTYLVAYIVGDFDQVSTVTESGIKVSVFTPVCKIQSGLQALEVGSKIVEYFNKFFGIKYVLPKVDLVAINDFSAGAMENWGLITFREERILIDKENTTQDASMDVHLVIAHEISHQWFGNLVTMEWWTDLWLNEGFATWIMYMSTHKCYPHFKTWENFFTSNYITALTLDSLVSSHAIEIEVKHTSEIDEIFDAISYCKGGSVIRMMYDYIGNQSFVSGLQNYIQKYSYQNVVTENLWECLSQSSGKDISSMMGSFTRQTGYPIISVIKEDTANGMKLTFSQKRFLLDSTFSLDGQLWTVPIKVLVKYKDKEEEFSLLLSKSCDDIVIPCSSKPIFIMVNPERIGFYCTLYSDDMLAPLLSHISEFSIQDRLGLLTDCYAYAKAGIHSVTKYLDMLKLFHFEKDEVVWEYIVSSLHGILLLISNSAVASDLELFKKFVNSLLKPVLHNIGLFPNNLAHSDSDDHTKQLRSKLLNLLVLTDQDTVIPTLRQWLSKYIKEELFVSPEYRSQMYTAGFQLDEMFDSILKLYQKHDLAEDKVQVLKGLAGLKCSTNILKVYQLCFTDSLRPQDSAAIFTHLGANPCAQRIGWDFIKSNYKAIFDRFQRGFTTNRIIKGSISNFCDKQSYEDIEGFFTTVSKEGIEKSLRQGLESIKINMMIIERDSKKLTSWLSQQ